MADSRLITNHGTADIVSLVPLGMPAGVDPRTWRQAIVTRLNELLDQSFALITALDMMEVDPDLEDGGDVEPSLGWTDRGPAALDQDCQQDDREQEVTDEPHDGDERELDPVDYDNNLFIWGGNEDAPRNHSGL